MTLSIIIPVYNAEKYIEACVRSLSPVGNSLGINPEDIEVILVDDGSKDNSGAICDRLTTEQFPFSCKAVHQPNQGVSVARNTGISHATGEWLWFIDADDYIEYLPGVSSKKQSLEPCNNFAVTGFTWEEDDKCNSFNANANDTPYNLWRCIFRSDIIAKKHIRFTQGRKYAEDQEFILKYLMSIKKRNGIALNNIFYHYTMRPGSAMTRKGIKVKQAKDILSVILSLLRLSISTRITFNRWFLYEIKRLTKTFLTVITK